MELETHIQEKPQRGRGFDLDFSARLGMWLLAHGHHQLEK